MDTEHATINLNPTEYPTTEDILSHANIDAAELAAHGLAKQRMREHRHEGRKHSAPVARYNEIRAKREENHGNYQDTSKHSAESHQTKRQIIETELAKDDQEYGELPKFYEKKKPAEGIYEEYATLFKFLGESISSDPNVIKNFESITDQKERLSYLLRASLSDKVQLFCSNQFDHANYDNFIQQLQFQQDFINGTATTWTKEWNDACQDTINIQCALDPSQANAEDITLGLNRASLKSAMIGTPEYGAYKMAKQISNSRQAQWQASAHDGSSFRGDEKAEYPTIFGHQSRIYGENIGDWAEIIDEYATIAAKIAKRNSDLPPEELEYKTVRNVAHIYAKSMEYQRPNKGEGSPYVSSFHESVAWAQLGEGVQAQLRGMRQKIMDIDLHNIERFIGKSGSSAKLVSYRGELLRLENQIKTMTMPPPEESGYNLERGIYEFDDERDAADKLLARENSFALSKQERWKERELTRIAHKYGRKIDQTRNEERRALYAQRRDEETQRVIQSFDEETSRLSNRDSDQFIHDVTARQELIKKRIEERKSLAEKAIDLHFYLNAGKLHPGEDYDYEENDSHYSGVIDWINYAPFGTIKRAHKQMNEGVPADGVYESAIQEIILRTVNDKDDANIELQQMFNAARNGQTEFSIRKVVELASKLKKYDITIDFDELLSISKKNTLGIEESMKAFEFDDVKTLISNDIDLLLAPKVDHIMKESGYDLHLDKLIDFTRNMQLNYAHHDSNFEKALSTSLQFFSLEEIQEAVSDRLLTELSMLKPFLVSQGVEADLASILELSRKILHQEDLYATPYTHADIINDFIKVSTACGIEAAHNLLDKDISLSAFNDARSNGLSAEAALSFPWLVKTYQHNSDKEFSAFPLGKNESTRHKWCSDHSFIHLDGDWGRQTLGKLIYSRLQTGVDGSLHDATQWLESFQVPETSYDIKSIKESTQNGNTIDDIGAYKLQLKDTKDEAMLLSKIISAPEELRGRLLLSRKKQNIAKLFSSPEHIYIYQHLADIYRNPELNFDSFSDHLAHQDSSEFYKEYLSNAEGKNSTWRISEKEFSDKVQSAMTGIGQSNNQNDERIGDIMQRLNQYGENRKAYIDDATSWLVKHTTSPQQTLTLAWGDRVIALSEGAEDTASAIKKWHDDSAFMIYVHNNPDIISEAGISKDEIMTTYKPFVKELTRVYSIGQSINAIGQYKRASNPNKTMPPQAITLHAGQREYSGEIFAYDDPRGMTIGHDTGCCMTIDGASDSCIQSGYRDSNAGFFALYGNDGSIVAQSYFYINPERPDTVIMDNIEANQGRDSNRIIDLYKDYFTEYLEERFKSDPNWQVRQVNIGTGYGDVAKPLVLRLPSADVVENISGIYSDAKKDQRLLIRLSDAQIAKAREAPSSEQTNPQATEVTHSPIPLTSLLSIDQLPLLRDLESRLYPENMRQYSDDDFAHEELATPGANKYSFLINSQLDAEKEAIGYCLAYEAKSESDPSYQGTVVYVADFGILPGERGGMAAMKGFDELLKRISENGITKVELGARESTSYRLFTSDWGQRYLQRHGFQLQDHGETDNFEGGERTFLLSLEKIQPTAQP